MGGRKKSTNKEKKPIGFKVCKKFTCEFCGHKDSVEVKM